MIVTPDRFSKTSLTRRILCLICFHTDGIFFGIKKYKPGKIRDTIDMIMGISRRTDILAETTYLVIFFFTSKTTQTNQIKNTRWAFFYFMKVKYL